MILTIRPESNRLYNIFINSYDYIYENILLNNNIDLTSNQDIAKKISHIMPAGGLLASFIAGLYFEKNVKYYNENPVQDKNYAFATLVISKFLKKSAIFSVGKLGNYRDNSIQRIYEDHKSWIDKVVEKNEKNKFEVIENAPHNTTLDFLNHHSEDWGWDGGEQFAYIIGYINSGIGEKNLSSSKHEQIARNIIAQI